MNISKSPKKKQEYFFKDTKKEKNSAHRKQKIIQNSADNELKNYVNEITMMKECLRNRFALKNRR